MRLKQTIIKKVGKMPGKTLAIFAGVHGNELTGVKVLKKIIKEVKVEAGTVYFIFANPEAINNNVRQIDKNLNRCFIKNNKGRTVEDKRARELMVILDQCDALLDLHSSNSKETKPFIICEKQSYQVAKIFDVNLISYGWDKFEPGSSDGYMNQQGKIGLCLEYGSVYNNCEELATKSVWQFLQFFKVIDNKKVKFNKRKQKFIKIIKAGYKKSNSISFVKEFKDFETLKSGQIFAIDGKAKYKAGKNQVIIFPRTNKKIGEEIFLIGRL